MSKENKIVFPSYLEYKDRIYSVRGYIGDNVTYKDNKAYIDPETNKVYICSYNEEPYNTDVPIIYVKNENGVITTSLSEPTNPAIMDSFTSERAYNIEYDTIVNNTNPDEPLYNEEAMRDMNAATSIYKPKIEKEDDFLKKIVKQCILTKNTDINKYKHQFPNKYSLTNMKSAVDGKTKMSTANFVIWAGIMGFDFELIAYDNGGDPSSPLRAEIHYNSADDSITIVDKHHR